MLLSFNENNYSLVELRSTVFMDRFNGFSVFC